MHYLWERSQWGLKVLCFFTALVDRKFSFRRFSISALKFFFPCPPVRIFILCVYTLYTQQTHFFYYLLSPFASPTPCLHFFFILHVHSFPPLCSLNPSFPMHLVTFTHPPPYFSHDSGGVAAGGGGPSRACRGSSSRLHARPQLRASTPTLECDGERGTGGEGRGGGVDSGQPGQILRPSGAASLTSISPVAVSVGEEEDDLKACWWTWSFGFGLGLCWWAWTRPGLLGWFYYYYGFGLDEEGAC